MATLAQLLKLSPTAFKVECNRVHNRIRRIKRAQLKDTATKTMNEELKSLKDYSGILSEAIRQWFKGSLPT